MGGDIQTIGTRQPQKLDPNAFKPKSGGRLDTLSQGNTKGLVENKERSLIKVVNYKPLNLKKLSADVQSTISKSKQDSSVREALLAIVTEKVQAVKQQNPFSKPIESQSGKNVDIAA